MDQQMILIQMNATHTHHQHDNRNPLTVAHLIVSGKYHFEVS